MVDTPAFPDVRLGIKPPPIDGALEVAVLLADRNRMSILAILRGGPHCVCELAAALDERSNNVSNHLARLREAGLVRASRIAEDTRRVYYERDEGACASARERLDAILEPAE
jgi:DNA-binding transcriptional ArsR family regulator